MKEAMLYNKAGEEKVQCNLCAHRCRIAPDKRGVCQVRENQAGTLYTRVYGRLIARHVDPIEKKPLFHFQPGSRSYSIAAPGCNFRCGWCQNASISQMPRDRGVIAGEEIDPSQIVRSAQEAGCSSIAYTYTEPTIFFEYAYDTARLAQEQGLTNVAVTNGYMTAEMLKAFSPYLDAANVDLKAFRDETYRRHVGARLQPVLDSIKQMKELGIWVEVTTLVIPELNDSDEELRDAARFIAQEVGPATPWHISAFFPAYEMTEIPPTPVQSLLRAREIGQAEGLHYVYTGNLRQRGVMDTICPSCGERLIQRRGFALLENRIGDERCPSCSEPIAGVEMGGPQESHSRDRRGEE